jgi:hypothetical protein
MDKEQAIQNFWSQFGIPAYDENSVPDDLRYPFITYSVATDMLDDTVSLYGNIFYRSPSWKDITQKKEQIAEYIGAGGVAVKIDTGYVYFCQGTPFAQRMSEPGDDMVKRYYIQLQAEFLTPY